MEFEFTILELLLAHFAFTNTLGDIDYWDHVGDAEPKLKLTDEERADYGIEYVEHGFSVQMPGYAKAGPELWQALAAPTVKRDLALEDLDVVRQAIVRCAMWSRDWRDYVFKLADKLARYQQSFQALEALNQLPREVVMKAAEGKLL